MKHYWNFVYYNPTSNKTRTHGIIQWFLHDDFFPFVPGTATTTNLSLTKLIATVKSKLNTNNEPLASDAHVLIRHVKALLHKRAMLHSVTPSGELHPSSIPSHDNNELTQQITQRSTSKGDSIPKRQYTIDQIRQIT